MVSVIGTVGLGCCRCFSALHASNSTGRGGWAGGRLLGTLWSSSSFRIFESRASGLANSKLSKGAGHSVISRPCLGPAPFGLCAVVGRGYWTEGGSPYGQKSSSTVQGAHAQYGQQQGAGEFPRPPIIHWEKDLANAVQLIGHVGRDVNIKYLDSGKVLATTCIAVKKGSVKDEEPSWFEIEIWDGLAEIAAHHIKKGEQIFVTGRIAVERWTKDDGQHTIAKVVVRDFCFVEKLGVQREIYGQFNGVEEEEYRDMGSNVRSRELSNTGSSRQKWDQQPLPQQSPGPTGQRVSKNYEEAALATEKKWQEFFADPTQWWDNRVNKRNPKSPDFKHKSTQEVLWVTSWNNPPWVQQQLDVLEAEQAHAGDFRETRSTNKKLSSFKDSDFNY